MDSVGEGMMLNLSSEGKPSSKKNRIKYTKKERIKRKKLERKQREDLLSQKLKDDSPAAQKSLDRPVSVEIAVDSKTTPHKRKHNEGHVDKKTKKQKVETSSFESRGEIHKKRNNSSQEDATATRYKSTLFYNNPDIPQITSAVVDTFSEKVFSGDSFEELNLHPYMVSNLRARLDVNEMTNVQKQTIPNMLNHKDVLVKSQTGSGKTLAYAVPIVQSLQQIQPKISRTDGTLAIVVVPTRELAQQSLDAFQKLVQSFAWVVPGCLMGGENRKAEKARLRKGLNIVISTPGRLVDHIENTQNLDLSRVQWLVIDEADRLLEMGFEKEVSKIVTALTEKSSVRRQTALLSATLSPGVERLAGMSLQNPVTISINTLKPATPQCDSVETDGSAQAVKYATPENLKHHCIIVPSKLRLVTLAAFILWKCKMATKRSKMIVFMATQDSVDFHFRLLSNTLLEEEEEQSSQLLYKLHGEMQQQERKEVFTQFKAADSGVLFCTDVAARGLNLDAVRWIVQYNPPGGATDYIHRVGRTARIGSRGNALLFLLPSEAECTKLLTGASINLIQVEMNDILKTLLLEKVKLNYLWADNEPPHTLQEAASLLQANFTNYVRVDQEARSMARKAYQSCIGAYAAYPSSVKHIFHMKNLHLGHFATSFALQEAPTKIGNIIGTQSKKQNLSDKTKKIFRHGPLPSSMHRSNASEFSSGIASSKISNQVKFTKKQQRKLNIRKK